MPDREKVMAGLVTCIAACNGKTVCLDCGYMHDYSGGCETQLLSDALALLKAQEPVKPYKINGRWFRSWHCGACGGFLGEVNNQKVNYCYHCGRAVKWE